MKRILFAAALAVTTVAVIAADVGSALNVGQPGFYGQIDIGGFPPPKIIYRQPRTIQRVAIDRPPIYLHVPPGHSRNWGKHCRKYNACGERVYFVHNNWYDREYVPHYQKRHRDREESHRHGHDHKDVRRDEHREKHRDERRDEQRGKDKDRHD